MLECKQYSQETKQALSLNMFKLYYSQGHELDFSIMFLHRPTAIELKTTIGVVNGSPNTIAISEI